MWVCVRASIGTIGIIWIYLAYLEYLRYLLTNRVANTVGQQRRTVRAVSFFYGIGHAIG